MPLVTSHSAGADGTVRIPHSDSLTLDCRDSRFLAFPKLSVLEARCDRGRLRLRDDLSVRDLLALGCRDPLFEDVEHDVPHCPLPLQGRAYLAPRSHRHALALCYDAERGLATRVQFAIGRASLAAHSDRPRPLGRGVLAGLARAIDSTGRREAEALFADDARLSRRLRALLGRESDALAGETLARVELASGRYLSPEEKPAARFVTNAVAAWSSVAEGNWRNLQRDVARLARESRRSLEVFAGTHDVATLRTESGPPRRELYLRPERRFPVPKYLWTVAIDASARRAIALVVLNDPFVAVSEIRDAVFCESVCGRLPWLKELRRNRNYETPLYGLAFCCAVGNFTRVTEMPREMLAGVPSDESGLLIGP